jgi:hypothetical protein
MDDPSTITRRYRDLIRELRRSVDMRGPPDALTTRDILRELARETGNIEVADEVLAQALDTPEDYEPA